MRLISRILFCAVVAVATARATVIDGDLAVNSFVPYAGQTNIVLQATGNIVFSGGTLNLPALPLGVSSGLLMVEAGNNVEVNNGATIVAGAGWSVVLAAGTTNFDTLVPPMPDVGDITFLGTASLVVAGGSINLLAGDSITVASGAIGTTGGDISLIVLMGSVSTGSGGQIGTVVEGTISISAGGDVSGTIVGTIINLTAGGITVISTGPAVPIDGGSSCPTNTGKVCPQGRFKAGYRHDHFRFPHFTLPRRRP
jgi:hypothetical protein